MSMQLRHRGTMTTEPSIAVPIVLRNATCAVLLILFHSDGHSIANTSTKSCISQLIFPITTIVNLSMQSCSTGFQKALVNPLI